MTAEALAATGAMSQNSPPMSRVEKLFDKVVGSRNDANFTFDDLCTLLTKLGYTTRKSKGSHIIFQRGSSS